MESFWPRSVVVRRDGPHQDELSTDRVGKDVVNDPLDRESRASRKERKTMTTYNFDEILKELRKPFHPSQVIWKPGSVRQDQTRALALAYADLRAYQNRLDEVCGMDWSVTYTPWGDRIVCHLTINGITRSSTGEPDSQSERSEIAGTSAEAQAFKRACAMFGLGRYLYQLPSVWVEYDASSKHFTAQAKAKLDGIIAIHYRKAMDAASAENSEETPHEVSEPDTNSGEENSGREPVEPNATEDTDGPEAKVASPPAESGKTKLLFDQFERLGRELYGEQWDGVRQHNVERITQGRTGNSGELNEEQIRKLIGGMRNLKRQRRELHARPNGKVLAAA